MTVYGSLVLRGSVACNNLGHVLCEAGNAENRTRTFLTATKDHQRADAFAHSCLKPGISSIRFVLPPPVQ